MDIVKYHNNTIAKSTRNPLTSLLLASLPLTFLLLVFLPPAFKPPIFSLPATFKKFNPYCTSASLKRQTDKIAVQNIQYKIAFKLYILAILF